MSFSMCWRGPPGSGKRRAVQQKLSDMASKIGQPYVLKKQPWDAPLQGGDGDSGEDEEPSAGQEKALLPMEISVVHWGFDIARMSLQDKQYIKTILSKWGRGSQVLCEGHSQRCLVFYHAHLLSSESIIYLQSFLEENHEDCLLLLTSEYSLPSRLADWCVEIPMSSTKDLSLERIKPILPLHLPIEEEIHQIYVSWMKEEAKLSDVKGIRAIVYALLHRNIRWTEGFHLWLFGLERLPLTLAQKKECAKICCSQPFTGAGQTVPSYRIPILWENYLCLIRNALAPT